MKFATVLVPYDGSEGAKNALAYAVEMQKDSPDTKLVVFASLAGAKDVASLVGRGREGTGFVDDETVNHFQKTRAKGQAKALENMKEEFEEIGGAAGPVEFVAEFQPSPVAGIIEKADEVGADAIVMGCRGVSAIAGMLGSVSFGVIRSAKIPVTVVK